LPTETPLPTPTALPTATLSIEERLTQLEEKTALPKKDDWDKAKIVTDIVIAIAAGLVLTGFSVWATKSFNERQLKSEDIRAKAQLESEELRAKNQLASEEQRAKEKNQIQEIQTVQSFMPHLASKDPRIVEGAILAITGLGNEKLAARLAGLFRNEGALAALNKMAASGNQAIVEAAERSLNEIYGQSIRKLVQVANAGEVRGAGFFVRQDGYIVTTNNVISGPGDVTVITELAAMPAKVINANEQDNLALLQVDGKGFSTLPLSDKELSPEILEEIVLIGYDNKVGLTVSIGKFAGMKNATEYPRSELISVSVITPRSYGGAVAFDKNGQLLGMVVSLWIDEPTIATTAYVLPIQSLNDFVKQSIPE
jgi:S1-C subfamily serine protease